MQEKNEIYIAHEIHKEDENYINNVELIFSFDNGMKIKDHEADINKSMTLGKLKCKMVLVKI